MEFALITLLILSIVGIVYIHMQFRRLNAVHRYKMHLLSKIDHCLNNYRTTQELDKIGEMLIYFGSISYDDMINQFWKPIESFYDESKFELNDEKE